VNKPLSSWPASWATIFSLKRGDEILIRPNSSGRPRAPDLGISFDGQPGPLNAITDVPGVEVGHTTLIEGAAVRTGVSVVWPRGRNCLDPVFGGWYSLNGNGEMTGTAWIEESGFVNGPIVLTNSHAVGFVRDTFIQWFMKHWSPSVQGAPSGHWLLPVVAETYDGFLNDINGFHLRERHVVEALEEAHSGPQEEGNVGAGTGTICYHFKAGIGTASRIVQQPARITSECSFRQTVAKGIS
jgi:D-aminopeptidase